ncbi:C-type lectin 37Db isoform X2 [Plutella xylostella]|uniref:C-type lectin 37Db isoform X2 n=1 Tax=Plutella xylostella TaxID=51655 RepID=UPI0020329A0E|nr:C-type lectin 37Db isoform X2 [Plutella xylostella]XP_048487508.1 C-type lectin 37Db isoform X2 [Plutella xylostella]XP_048487509.1 C-type lectin 37Db isoform X2 [Plutella xylostella]
MCRFEFILLVMSVVWVAGAWGAHYPTSLNSIGGKTAQQENRNWLKSETQDTLKEDESECSSCGSDDELGVTRWTMPLLKTGEKRYYLGIFFKANWFKAQQYCRFHGMHLASVSSQEENDKLEKYVKDSGYGREHFWTSGTDLAEEGNFFWMANGRPLTFVNWNAGEPNNFRYENGEEENCLELWNRDDKGLKWNDSPCSFETFFICEVRSD